MNKKQRHTGGEGIGFKAALFAILAAISFWVANKTGCGAETPEAPGQEQEEICHVPQNLFPAVPQGDLLVRHSYFALAFNPSHGQADWVAYEITRDRLNMPRAERPNTFRPDRKIPNCPTPRDYAGSGYDRGHLCAAADMAFDAKALDETFFMSNMSPQERTFNGGVWRELEECSRDWARRYRQLTVVTGPVLRGQIRERIGAAGVSVPELYYRVLYNHETGKGIGFLIPNQQSDHPLMDYACSIAEVEATTGLTFFPELLRGNERQLKASYDKSAWPVKQERYLRRLEEWNKR